MRAAVDDEANIVSILTRSRSEALPPPLEGVSDISEQFLVSFQLRDHLGRSKLQELFQVAAERRKIGERYLVERSTRCMWQKG